VTSEISRQVFPLTLDLDNPKFHEGLERLRRIAQASADAKAKGGVIGGLKRIGLAGAAGLTFVRLYLLPTRGNALPERIRLAPAW
jgi:magnesium-protoporphyrin IX monomethyl ester (oxidative) cyclase